MQKFRVGVLGLGYIGVSHVDALRRIPGVELVAVTDVNADAARKKAEEFGLTAYETIDELLADKTIDVVHNCTPNHLHMEFNKKIIESGKHMFSEKPLARDYCEAEELLKVAAAHPDVVCGVNFNYRMNPMVQEMRRRVEKGEIGKVFIASGAYQQDHLMYDTDYNWRLEKEYSGKANTVADIGSHWMDAVQHITGQKITAVMADLVTTIPYRKKPKKAAITFTDNASADYELRKIETEDYAAVMFKMSDGATGVYHVSQVSAGHGCCFGIEINGSKASMRWNQEENDRLWMGFRNEDNRYIIRNPNAIDPEIRACTALAKGHPEGWNDAFCGNIRAFYEYLRSDRSVKPQFASLEDAAYIVKLTEAIVKSSEEKRWIEL